MPAGLRQSTAGTLPVDSTVALWSLCPFFAGAAAREPAAITAVSSKNILVFNNRSIRDNMTYCRALVTCKNDARVQLQMRLLQQPGDGVMPIVSAINSAKSTIEIAIFRFDQREIERALAHAVSRGVAVHALIAHVNSSGEESLRKLEMRLLAAGVTVARTGGDFARYHYKLLIVDHSELYLLAFNFTHHDMNRSRSFGLVIDDRKLVQEAIKLFQADVQRQSYEPGVPGFVVSPE